MKTLKLSARAMMSRPKGGERVNPEAPDPFELHVIDKASGIPILNIVITPDQMADLLSCRVPDSHFEVELMQSPLHGRTRETKIVRIPVASGFSDATAAQACTKAEQQNPGWEVRPADRTWNSHRYRDKHYAITLMRWVQKTDSEDE